MPHLEMSDDIRKEQYERLERDIKILKNPQLYSTQTLMATICYHMTWVLQHQMDIVGEFLPGARDERGTDSEPDFV